MRARVDFCLLPLLALALVPPVAPARAADTSRTAEEARLLAVLASPATMVEREAAVVRLHRIGSERAVPELAKLLSDAELSHAARHALEAMPFASSGRALVEALSKTSGPVRLGLVSSLASRREVAAVPALAALLRDVTDSAGAEAAAHALAMIPDASALSALETVWPDASGSVRTAVIDALLAQAWRLLGAGELEAGDHRCAAFAYEIVLEGHRPVRRVHDRAHRVVGHGHQAMTDTERLGNRFGDCGATCARREQRADELDVVALSRVVQRRALMPLTNAVHGRLARRLHEVGARHGAELGADENGRPPRGRSFGF